MAISNKVHVFRMFLTIPFFNTSKAQTFFLDQNYLDYDHTIYKTQKPIDTKYFERVSVEVRCLIHVL